MGVSRGLLPMVGGLHGARDWSLYRLEAFHPAEQPTHGDTFRPDAGRSILMHVRNHTWA